MRLSATSSVGKLLFVVKPHMLSTIGPSVFKGIFFAIIGAGIAVAILAFIGSPLEWAAWAAAALFAITAVPGAIRRGVKCYNTKYYFFASYLTSEFELVRVKKFSIAYSHILGVSSTSSVFERLASVGDVNIHTHAKTYVLENVRHPHKVEEALYSLIRRHIIPAARGRQHSTRTRQ